jgi:predicted RNA binding protein YcfA (HicA-like mRNA interferase family)
VPKLRRLTAKQILVVLMQFDFVVASQRGSHIKLMRIINDQKQILTIPNHTELDTGSRYISSVELYPYFYTE